jgi:hypothetical protein
MTGGVDVAGISAGFGIVLLMLTGGALCLAMLCVVLWLARQVVHLAGRIGAKEEDFRATFYAEARTPLPSDHWGRSTL